MRYSNDPRWITVKYQVQFGCSRCHEPIARGARAFFYPIGKQLLCDSENCGKQAARDFEAARSDEEGY